MTDEQKVLKVLEQQPFSVFIGGQEVRLKPLVLSRFDQMGALSSVLPLIDVSEEELQIADIIPQNNEGKTLAEIIFISAKPMIKSDIKRKWYQTKSMFQSEVNKDLERKERAVFDLIYHEMGFLEMRLVIKEILDRSHIFFYKDCIDSLKGANRLKRTKETDRTVLM